MKKLNKLFLGAGAVAAVAAPIAAVVSCGSSNDSGIYLALDGHDHSAADMSFNQQAKEGIVDFAGNPSIVKPAAPDGENEFKQMYATVPKGATMVAAGYAHVAPLMSASEEIDGKKIVLLDGEAVKPNIASVVFKVEQAAYLAGYATAEYAATQAGFTALDVNNDGTVNLTTFGGMAFPTVTGYMGGFKAGIEAALTAIASDTATYPKAANVKFLKLTNKEAHFSGGFAAGGGQSIVTNLKAAKADVILPVAGPQTKDVIDFGGNIKVIGVDSAQENQYSAYKSRFLFSILKDLRTATLNTLKKLNGDTTVDASYLGLGHTTVGTLDNNLVGVSSLTKEVSTLYDAAKQDSKILTAAKAQGTDFTF